MQTTLAYYDTEMVESLQSGLDNNEFRVEQEGWAQKEIFIRRELTSGIHKILELLSTNHRYNKYTPVVELLSELNKRLPKKKYSWSTRQDTYDKMLRKLFGVMTENGYGSDLCEGCTTDREFVSAMQEFVDTQPEDPRLNAWL